MALEIWQEFWDWPAEVVKRFLCPTLRGSDSIGLGEAWEFAFLTNSQVTVHWSRNLTLRIDPIHFTNKEAKAWNVPPDSSTKIGLVSGKHASTCAWLGYGEDGAQQSWQQTKYGSLATVDILEQWGNGASDIQRAHSKGTRNMKSDTVRSCRKDVIIMLLACCRVSQRKCYSLRSNKTCPFSFQEITPCLPRGSRSRSGSQSVSSFPISNPSAILLIPSKISPKPIHFPIFTSMSTSRHCHHSWVSTWCS